MKIIEITPEEWREIQRMLELKDDWVKHSNTREFAELMEKIIRRNKQV